MVRILVTLFLGYLFLVISSVWHRAFGFYIRPDFVLILVIYLGFTAPDYKGVMATAFIGYMIDIFSGYLIGMNMVLSLTTFALTLAAARFFSFKSIFTRILYTFIIYLAIQALMLFLLKIFVKFAPVNYFVIMTILKQAFLTLIAAPFIFILMDKLEEKFWQEERQAYL